MIPLLAVGAGVAGSLARHFASHAVQVHWDRDWPSGSIAVNLLGAALIGLVVGATHGDVRLVLAGAVAGFTTFSAWMVEAVTLWDDGPGGHARASLDLVLPMVVGIAAAAVGLALGRAF